jgi:hypothetical protein
VKYKTKAGPRKKKNKKTQYCLYAGTCDKDNDCYNGAPCTAFRHTDRFSSLRMRGN